MRFVEIETVALETLDGVNLIADIASGPSPTVAAVIAHPHPMYGGDRHNHVVDSLWRSIAAQGGVAVRFDFRGAGSSGGRHDSGRAERLDVLAALDHVTKRHGHLDVWLVGYSFGAIIAADIDDERVAGWVLIAPPFNTPGDLESVPNCGISDRPTLILTPQHDEFCPPATIERLCGTWPATHREVIPWATHGLVAQGSWLASRVTSFIGGERHRSAPPGQTR